MSSINPNNIDGTYPIAGQDNDSQGFRDNFTNIKNNFTFAYDELTDLQSKVVLKSALSGGSLNNNLNYSQLVSAQIKGSVETLNNLATVSGNQDIDWSDGHFQYFTTGANVSLTFSGWPTSGYYAKMRLQANVASVAHQLTFGTITSGLNQVTGANLVSKAVTVANVGLQIFEVSSYDAGATITILPLLQQP